MSTWRDQPAECQLPDWIRGWTVARFRHGDQRLWQEQQEAYEDLNRQWHDDGHAASAPSGYDWSGELEQRGLMPAKDRKRYIEEGAALPAQAVVALMAGAVAEATTVAASVNLDEIDIPF